CCTSCSVSWFPLGYRIARATLRQYCTKRLFRLGGHRPDQGLQLRAHRQVEALSAGQALQEPALVLALDLAVLREIVERAPHDLGELRVALAEHDAVRVVGEELADHLVLLLRLVLREQAV